MTIPWYYLERPTRVILLRCYYALCACSYPLFVGLNWKSYVPSRAEVNLDSLRHLVLNKAIINFFRF
ncbi:unnamed protein product [Angiostrongylus costaricensis]|uniref:Uncharacterized protein n=1 Tax=Angiostrongylus costaricensis TaxID=334426 RepID=A0A0R3PQ24_ANGCS|nr:unnamed protein product [Angiostrongylus costaricensis]